MEISNSRMSGKYLSLLLWEHNWPGWFSVDENGWTQFLRPFSSTGKHVCWALINNQKPLSVFKTQWIVFREQLTWLRSRWEAKQTKRYWSNPDISPSTKPPSLLGREDAELLNLRSPRCPESGSPRRTDEPARGQWERGRYPGFSLPPPFSPHWPQKLGNLAEGRGSGCPGKQAQEQHQHSKLDHAARH